MQGDPKFGRLQWKTENTFSTSTYLNLIWEILQNFDQFKSPFFGEYENLYFAPFLTVKKLGVGLKGIKPLNIPCDFLVKKRKTFILFISTKKNKINMNYLPFLCLLLTVQMCTGPPVPHPRRVQKPEPPKDRAATNEAQDQEYFRYLTQVVGELEKDEKFKEILNKTNEEDIKSGKLAEHIDMLDHNVRMKLDEVSFSRDTFLR